jgi:hypothetical protein
LRNVFKIRAQWSKNWKPRRVIHAILDQKNNRMKQFFIRHLGKNWLTVLAGYVFAVMLALQPLLDIEVDFSRKPEIIRYVARIFLAAAVAVSGKYLGKR